jgi:hypothetical protein
MHLRSCLLSGLTVLLGACALPSGDGPDVHEEAATAGLRAVDITVSSSTTDETYEARPYPHSDINGDGVRDLYRVPVYRVFIDGTDANGVKQRREWTALRFMPYFNDPKDPVSAYKTRGWVNSGLGFVGRKPVPQFKPDYEVHNSFSKFGGAFVVRDTFYIHAGPDDLSNAGWGSAGCVEIIGNFDDFKAQVIELSGSTTADRHVALGEIVRARKLFVRYEPAAAPDIKASFSRQANQPPAPAPVAGPQTPPEGEPEGTTSP